MCGSVNDSDDRLKLLDIGSNVAFKLWLLLPKLQLLTAAFCAAVLAVVIWICWKFWTMPLLTVGRLVVFIVSVSVVSLFGSKLIRTLESLRSLGFNVAASVLGCLLAKYYLRRGNPVFIKLGRLDTAEKTT
jgi:hypothetical protein